MRRAAAFPAQGLFTGSLAVVSAGSLLLSTGFGAGTTSFEAARKVLETKCLSCHCPEKSKGELLLTTREGFLKGGESGAAIHLEQVDKSELLTRVKLDEDDDEIMPPKGGPLKAEDIAVLETWLKEGAPW